MANDVFGALAHPLRREIVERLSQGPVTVGEATRDFAVSKPTISRHLRMLEEARVVSRAIDGREARPLAVTGSAGDWIHARKHVSRHADAYAREDLDVVCFPAMGTTPPCCRLSEATH